MMFTPTILAILVLVPLLPAVTPLAQATTPDLLWKEGGHLAVTSIAFTPDGTLLASGGQSDNTVKIWSVTDASFIRTLTAHYGSIHGLAISPDGTMLASTGEPVFGLPDDGVKLWRISDGTLIRTLPTGYQEGWSVSFSPDGTLLAAGTGYDVRIYRVSDGTLVRTLSGHSWFVFGVAFSPDGTRIASGSGDNTARIWRVSDGTLLRTLSGHTFFVNAVAFSPSGLTLATGSWDNTVRLWRVNDGLPQGTLTHGDPVYTVAWAPGGASVASGANNTVKLWAFPGGVLQRTITAPYVASIAFLPNGSLVGGGGYEGHTRLWNPADGTLLRTFGHHTGSVKALAYAPSGANVGTIAEDVTGRLWHVSDGTEYATLIGHNDILNDIAISTGAVVATCSGSPPPTTIDPRIFLWQESDGSVIRVLPGHTDGTTSVSFRSDAARLASGGFDDKVRIWRVSDGLQLNLFNAGVSGVRRVRYSPDGTLLAVSGFSTGVKILNSTTGALVRTVAAGYAPSSIDFSPDGAMLALGLEGYGDNVVVFRVSDGSIARTLPGDDEGFNQGVAFSADSDVLASTSGYTFDIMLWRVSTGELLATYDQETGWGQFPALPIDFSPDGTKFAYGRADASVCLARNPFAAATSVATPGSGSGREVAFIARPNPFTEVTDIRFSLAGEANVAARIVDVRGREIERIEAGRLTAGAHELRWDGRDAAGRATASGLYFAEVVANGRTIARGKILRIAPN